MPQGIIIVAMSPPDFTQHCMHPGFAFAVASFAEESQGLLGMLASLLVMSLFTEEHRQFIERPGFLITLILLAVQGYTTFQATERLGKLPKAAQDGAQAILYRA